MSTHQVWKDWKGRFLCICLHDLMKFRKQHEFCVNSVNIETLYIEIEIFGSSKTISRLVNMALACLLPKRNLQFRTVLQK